MATSTIVRCLDINTQELIKPKMSTHEGTVVKEGNSERLRKRSANRVKKESTQAEQE